MSKFNTTSKVKPDTTNLAGGDAFSMSVEEELTHGVLTTFLEDKFYESGVDRADRLTALVSKADPVFVAKLAVFARDEFHLRSVSTLLLARLARLHRGDDLVKRAIVRATERVDDLTELVALVQTPLPKQVKRGVRNALLKFDRYQLGKYKAEGKAVSLVDLFNLVHPKAQHASEEQVTAWKDLMEGNLKSTDTWESEVSAGKTEQERKEAFEKLILENKMGYMALLRNLNNLVKYGVSDEVIAKAVAKLSDKDEVKKSKQLPFRFVTAHENVRGNRLLTDAISQAMDHSVDNVETFEGKTLIAIDGSGSMTMGMSPAIKVASVFAAAIAKANPTADVVMFDTSIKDVTVSSRSTIMDIAEKIRGDAHGGGTATHLVFDYAISKNIKYDRIIILSDNEAWSGSAQNAYNKYKGMASPYVYAVDIQGYGTKDIDDKKVRHIAGWSDRLLEFINESEGDLISKIKAVEL